MENTQEGILEDLEKPHNDPKPKTPSATTKVVTPKSSMVDAPSQNGLPGHIPSIDIERPPQTATSKPKTPDDARPTTSASRHFNVADNKVAQSAINTVISEHVEPLKNTQAQNISVGPVFVIQHPPSSAMAQPPPSYQEAQVLPKSRPPTAAARPPTGQKVADSAKPSPPKAAFNGPSKENGTLEKPKTKAEKGKKDMAALKKEVEMVNDRQVEIALAKKRVTAKISYERKLLY